MSKRRVSLRTIKQVGRELGQAMAELRFSTDGVRTWHGVDASDIQGRDSAYLFYQVGLEPNTPEWREAEACAEKAFHECLRKFDAGE
jgi:hypothetical protein